MSEIENPENQEGLKYESASWEPDWYKTNIPCQVGCPAHTDVSTYIGLISQGRFDEAYLLNRNANVVPGVLGRTCAKPCEPVCRRNKIDGRQVFLLQTRPFDTLEQKQPIGEIRVNQDV